MLTWEFVDRASKRMHPMKARYRMLERFAKGAGLVAVGLVLIVGQGCKKKQVVAPVQPVVRTVPRPATPDFPDDPLPPEPVAETAHRTTRHVAPAQIVQAPRQTVDSEGVATVQRERDANLLQQQQAASQKQQQELNGVVQQSLKIQQEQQAEPRIQEVPEVPIAQPAIPGQEGQRIQDNPLPPVATPQTE